MSVNPVDVKQRAAQSPSDRPTILGYDASGVVEAAGAEVSTLSVGDEVWYAGDIRRQGTNAEFHAVDERIAARKPKSLSFAEAAALPLTTITAWETLFDRFGLTESSRGDLLVLFQRRRRRIDDHPARQGADRVRVIATASRDDSRQWATDLGADAVIDHHDRRAGPLGCARRIDYLFSPHSRGNVDAYAQIMRPFGHITAIDEPPGLDLVALKEKSIAWHWELMFTRSLFETPDMIEQQKLLARTAELSTRALCARRWLRQSASSTRRDYAEAHRAVESGRMIGKAVVHR
jgi:zinc-binding alcohol dehydrogenase family protein